MNSFRLRWCHSEMGFGLLGQKAERGNGMEFALHQGSR